MHLCFSKPFELMLQPDRPLLSHNLLIRATAILTFARLFKAAVPSYSLGRKTYRVRINPDYYASYTRDVQHIGVSGIPEHVQRCP